MSTENKELEPILNEQETRIFNHLVQWYKDNIDPECQDLSDIPLYFKYRMIDKYKEYNLVKTDFVDFMSLVSFVNSKEGFVKMDENKMAPEKEKENENN